MLERIFCTLPFARVIVRLSESMLDGCLLKKEIQENNFFFVSLALSYLLTYLLRFMYTYMIQYIILS